MAAVVSVTEMSGLFKTVYGEIQNVIPSHAILQKAAPFVSSEKENGNYFAQPVLLSLEGGFTYTGSAQTAVATLNAAVAGESQEAQVYGSEIVLRSQMLYSVLSRASRAGPKAFKKASAHLVEGMAMSIRKRIELGCLYGQVGLGTVSSRSSQVLTLTDASWAGGIWAGMKGASVDVYSSDLVTLRNGGGHNITAVDVDNKTITLDGTVSAMVATDVIFFKGAKTNEMAGIQKIISNSGTLFNISAATYDLWKGITKSSVGQLSHAKIQDAVSLAVNKGLTSDLLCLLSPKGWAVLNSDQAALRMFDKSYEKGKAENGAEELVFHSQNGAVKLKAHPFVKDGDAFLLPTESLMRVGSTDVTFGVPGMDEQFFTLVSGQNAVELQCMTDQAIFIEKPGHAIYMSGITYS